MGNDSAGTGKDLLSRVVRANMDPSLRADQKMTEEEVVDQISTFVSGIYCRWSF